MTNETARVAAPVATSANGIADTSADGTAEARGAIGVRRRGRTSRRPRPKQWTVFPAVFLAALVSAVFAGQTAFPDALRVQVGSWFQEQYEKLVISGAWLYEPLAAQLTAVFDGLLESMTLIAAPVIVALVVGIVTVLRGSRLGLLSGALFAWVLLTDLWQPTLETFAFMVVAVALSAVAGLVLGVVGSLSSRLDSAVRLLVDIMQAFPSFAYMVPAIVLLGIGNTAALVVTIIWAALRSPA